MRRWLRLNPVHYSSASSEWETPQDLFDFLAQRWTFTLDVCATEDNAKCQKHFDKDTDGLKQSWAGDMCWMNSPYGREIGAWVHKACDEALQNHVTTVALLPVRTDTRWFEELRTRAATLWWIPGRLCFVGAPHPAPFPSMIVSFAWPRWDTALHYGALKRRDGAWAWS